MGGGSSSRMGERREIGEEVSLKGRVGLWRGFVKGNGEWGSLEEDRGKALEGDVGMGGRCFIKI